MADRDKEFVVLGGSGKTGRRVARRLTTAGHAVRVASRSTPIAFDWEDSRTWAEAIGGAAALYVSYQPDLALPGAEEHVQALARMAAARGVQRMVLLTGRGEPQTKAAEQAVLGLMPEATVLECSFFCQNFSEGLLAPQGDVVAFPAGAVCEPFVDCDDIAEVAVRALTQPGHAGKTYDLTGPRALSFAEATRHLAAASGRPLRYEQVTFEAYGQLLAQHLPPPTAGFFLELFRFLLDGHNSGVSDDLPSLLGRPARAFEEYARGAVNAWR